MTKARDDKNTTPPDTVGETKGAELERQAAKSAEFEERDRAREAELERQEHDPKAKQDEREELDRMIRARLLESGPPPMVQIRIGGTDDKPELRPAIPTVADDEGQLNLLVLMDGLNDRAVVVPGERERINPVMRWCTGVSCGSAAGQWRPFGGE